MGKDTGAITKGQAVFDKLDAGWQKAGPLQGAIDKKMKKDVDPITNQLDGLTKKATSLFDPPESTGPGFSEIVATGVKVTDMLK